MTWNPKGEESDPFQAERTEGARQELHNSCLRWILSSDLFTDYEKKGAMISESGRVLIEAGDADGAVALLEAAVNYQNFPAVLLPLADAYQALGDDSNLLRILERMTCVDPFQGDHWMRLADFHECRGELEEALEVLRGGYPYHADDTLYARVFLDALCDRGPLEEALAVSESLRKLSVIDDWAIQEDPACRRVWRDDPEAVEIRRRAGITRK